MESRRLTVLIALIVLFVGLAVLVYLEVRPINPASQPRVAAVGESGGTMAASPSGETMAASPGGSTTPGKPADTKAASPGGSMAAGEPAETMAAAPADS